ncbi:MAG TPA: Do family serine endopeptidase [Alphaproteobacteria bacterium]
MTAPLRAAWMAALVLLIGAGPGPAAAAFPFDDYTIAPLIKQVTPGVVNIAVRSRVRVENPLLNDPFFRRFFNLPRGPIEQEILAAGSGVIIDVDKGYVLTNHHVVENADQIIVTLKDGRRFEAKLVGSDAPTEVALLQIDADNLTALRLGDSDKLEVGDFVVAIGNPFGLGQTVTSGIISALGRSGINPAGYEDFIQTDASINPGNSGGALVNLRGELVGINTAIIAPSGGNVGIGFAVPINMARSVVAQLVRYGSIQRGRVGVAIQDLTPDLAESLGIPRGIGGAVVVSVEPGSPAANAGLKPGDVIIAMDGRPVRNASDLRNDIGLVRVGTTIELTVLRGGERLTVRPRVAPAPAESRQRRAR